MNKHKNHITNSWTDLNQFQVTPITPKARRLSRSKKEKKVGDRNDHEWIEGYECHQGLSNVHTNNALRCSWMECLNGMLRLPKETVTKKSFPRASTLIQSWTCASRWAGSGLAIQSSLRVRTLSTGATISLWSLIARTLRLVSRMETKIKEETKGKFPSKKLPSQKFSSHLLGCGDARKTSAMVSKR